MGTVKNSGNKKRKKKSLFAKILTISVLVFFVALLGFLIFFFNWLEDYENSERHHVAESVVASLSDGNYEWAAGLTDVVSVGLEDGDTYAEAIRSVAEGRTISYVKAFSYDRFEHPTYKILADGEYLCKLVLKKSGKSKYDFDTYDVDYFTGFSFGDASAAFLLPSYYTAYCNGVELDSKFVVQDGLNSDLFRYALTDEQSPSMCRYEISGLSSNAVIEAEDAYGNRILLDRAGGKYSAEFKSMRFYVPEGITVSVCGTVLDEKFAYELAADEMPAGGSDISVDGVRMLSGSGSGTTAYKGYRVDYLGPDAEYYAVDGAGRQLELRLTSAGIYTSGVKVLSVVAPEGAPVTVDGRELTGDGSFITESGIAVDELSTIHEAYLPSRPVFTEYRFALIEGEDEPVVRVQNTLGQWQTLSEENGEYRFSFRVEEDIPELTALALRRTKNYAEYITNDLDKDTFMAGVLHDQPIYSELVDNPYYFYTGHQRHWFENEAWSDLRYYNEDCFSCEVSFDYFIADIKTDHDFVTSMHVDVRFWFVRYSGAWYMAEWELMDAASQS